MTLEEIKQAVLSGKTVHWSNHSYKVEIDYVGEGCPFVICSDDGRFIALTWSDGVTLNGKEDDFYVAVSDEQMMRQALLDLAEEVGSIAESLARNTIEPWPLDESARLKKIADHMVNAARS